MSAFWNVVSDNISTSSLASSGIAQELCEIPPPSVSDDENVLTQAQVRKLSSGRLMWYLKRVWGRGDCALKELKKLFGNPAYAFPMEICNQKAQLRWESTDAAHGGEGAQSVQIFGPSALLSFSDLTRP